MRRRDFVGGLAGTAAGLGLTATAVGPATAASMTTPGHRTAGTGTAAHRTATRRAAAWQTVPAPAARPGARLYGVAAPRPEVAWAVGVEGLGDTTQPQRPVALHWDGTAWSRTDLAHLTYSGPLYAVAAAGPRTAWAVGTGDSDQSHLLTWDGTTWQETRFPGSGTAGTVLNDVTATRDGCAWAAGRHGDRAGLLHWNGRAWRWCPPLPQGTPTPARVHVTPSGEVWVCGDVIARWDGAWTVIARGTGLRSTLTGILPVTHDDIWLTGYSYGVGGPPGKPPSIILQHWDGTAWSTVKAPFSIGLLSSIVGDERGRPDRITGWDFWDQSRAHYLRWDGTAWVSERGPELPPAVLMTELTPIPGTSGYWSVGTTSFYPNPPAQLHIERFG
ncbi:hypothetical protein [Streptomyces sp. MST-110588]|uniref:hypothetical protein n=1 Tax=Streptomyces sp. MST-110588 TaxID=2833628 RepID=UPI001F5E1096|nr:hypothetical protein [Streptomyces sp. MST-110588]UNO38887.1 hypothetical protein KGS77_03550 [Streptomyces sp. MST-110588]